MEERVVLIVCDACQQAERRTSWAALCPPAYQRTDEKRLIALVGPERFQQVMKWAAYFSDDTDMARYGLLLYSKESGRGKTRLVWHMLKTILPRDFIAFDGVSFGHELVRHYKEGDAEEWLDKVGQASLVFFDDLGKLKLTERAEAELYGVIERRCAWSKPIVATTNESASSLENRMTEGRGAAVVRRLSEFCETIQF